MREKKGATTEAAGHATSAVRTRSSELPPDGPGGRVTETANAATKTGYGFEIFDGADGATIEADWVCLGCLGKNAHKADCILVTMEAK